MAVEPAPVAVVPPPVVVDLLPRPPHRAGPVGPVPSDVHVANYVLQLECIKCRMCICEERVDWLLYSLDFVPETRAEE